METFTKRKHFSYYKKRATGMNEYFSLRWWNIINEGIMKNVPKFISPACKAEGEEEKEKNLFVLL